MKQWLIVISGLLTCAIGIWRYFAGKRRFKKQQAEQAKKDLDNAIKNDSPSDFLDGFSRM